MQFISDFVNGRMIRSKLNLIGFITTIIKNKEKIVKKQKSNDNSNSTSNDRNDSCDDGVLLGIIGSDDSGMGAIAGPIIVTVSCCCCYLGFQ
jgi:ribonuclease HIII